MLCLLTIAAGCSKTSIAPVAGKPPNSAEPILAAPWAMTSAFGRTRPPIMRSATIADSSDSTPARNAMTSAEGSSSIIFPSDRDGMAGAGNDWGNAP